jgi:hypothetical protein
MPRRRTVSPAPHPAARRLPSRYRLAAVGVAVVSATVVVVALPGGQPQPTARIVAPPTGTAAPDRATTTTADPEPEFPALLPTASSPLRVLEIGDSLGIDLGDQLSAQLDTALAHTTVASLGDTGLANIAYYDWSTHLAALLATDHPQVVVVFLGANDDQGIVVNGRAAVPGSPAWTAGYAQRVDVILHEASGAGARVVWVGMPPMASPELNATVALEDRIFRSQTAASAQAVYVSATAVLGTSAGLYESYGVDASGQRTALRTPDGVHLTPAGAGLLARTVIDAIDGRWQLNLTAPGPPGSPATGARRVAAQIFPGR